MPNFATDLTALPFPKTDKTALPVGEDATKHVAASDWNALCQAAVDLRGSLLAAPVAQLRQGFEGAVFPPARFETPVGSTAQWEFETASPLDGAASARPSNIGQTGTEATLRLQVTLAAWSVISFRFATNIHFSSRLTLMLDYQDDAGTIENPALFGSGPVSSRLAGGVNFAEASQGVKDSVWMSKPLAPGVHHLLLTYSCNSATDTQVLVDSVRVDPIEMAWDGWRDDFERGTAAAPIDPLRWSNVLDGSLSETTRDDGSQYDTDEGFGWILLTAGNDTSAAGSSNLLAATKGHSVPVSKHQFVEARFRFGSEYASQIEFGITSDVDSAPSVKAMLEPGADGLGTWQLQSDSVAAVTTDVAALDCAGEPMVARLVTTASGTDLYLGYGSSNGNGNNEQLVRVATVADAVGGQPFLRVTNTAGNFAEVEVDYIRAGWLSRFYALANSFSGGGAS